MRITLLTNKSNILAFREMIELIKLDENSLIIVPDKFSLNAEQMFFEEKKVLASFSTQVFSLTKLASKVLEKKLRDVKLIDKNVSLMIISSIISENLHNFKYFKSVKDINDISEDIFNVISQLLSSDIREFNTNLNGSLKDKFEDLNLILNEYKQRKENYLIDASKKYELFLNEIKNSEFIKDRHFYFAMFNSLTQQVKDIIKEICKYAKSVTLSTSKSENRINNNEILEFYNSLKPEKEIKGKLTPCKLSSFIEKEFFTNNKNILQINDEVNLYEAKNIDLEIDNLICEIKKEILFNNLRYKDISVCLSNLNIYKDKIINKFDENNISFFVDSDIKLLDNGYVKFILDFVKLFSNFNVNKMISLIKNSYIKLDDNIKNNFERFLFKYSISGDKTLTEFEEFKNDNLYSDYLYVFNNIIEKIYNFQNRLKNVDVYEFFIEFNKLLEEFKSNEVLKQKIEYYLNSDILKYKQYKQIEGKILECEKSICEYYNEEFSIKKICKFLELCFDNITISVPATSVDAVFVGDALNSYFKFSKKLFVLGADSNNFPCLKQDVSLFTDGELDKFEINNKIGPKVRDTNKVNYYKAFQVLLNAERISLSYSLTDDKGTKRFPSNIFKNFTKKFTKNGEELKALKVSNETLEYFNENEILDVLSLKFNNKKDYLKQYLSLDEGKEKQVLENILKDYYKVELNESDENKVDKNLININKFTASNLENYFTCPNKFLYKDILKLKKFEPFKLDAKNFGNIVHSCCYHFAKLLSINDKPSDNEKNDIIEKVLNEDSFKTLKFLDNSNQIINNLKTEIKKLFDFIILQQQNSNFKLKKAEYKFEYKENDIVFKGFVDRIDENEDEFIVIDYKTGSTKIEYSEIVFCKKIQLLLYAKILEKVLNKKCKGIYYLSINNDFSKSSKLKIYLNGITRNTNNMIYKLDNSIYEDKSLKSNYFEFKDKYLLSDTQFDNLLNYTYKKVLDAINKIKNAEFGSSVLILNEFNACDFCDYYEICKNIKQRKEVFTESLIEEILDD